MTGQVLAFPEPRAADEREALIAALAPLHAAITLDPIMGASPVRVYFVLNPQAREQIVACLDPGERARARAAPAFALVAFDFPFALQLVQASAPQFARGQAQDIASRSAGLQGDALSAAASAFGLDARAIAAFDAHGLKSAFFPNTQETVTHLFGLGLQTHGAPPR